MRLEGISVADAAKVLSVDGRRVRAMIDAGRLEAQKLSGSWVIAPQSLERARARPAPRGRPLAEPNAWGILAILAGEEPRWVNAHQRSRLRSYLRANGPDRVLPRLRDRARVVRRRAHPRELPRIAGEPGVVLGGISAAEAYEADVESGALLEAYVRAGTLQELERDYRLRETEEPNVVLRSIEEVWPFDPDLGVAPVSAVALDLMEGDDPRARRAGQQLAKRLVWP